MNQRDLLRELILRGIQGRLEDLFIRQIVQNEWSDVALADETILNQQEAPQMAEQIFAMCEGLDK